MTTFNMTWEGLRKSVKDCPFTDCPRNNKDNLSIFFNRKEDFLSKINFLVVSQEPGISLRNNCNSNAEEMENYLIKSCLQSKPKGTSPINKMIEFFGNFDPSNDEIYWTHALKCVPRGSDSQIRVDWKDCAPYCVKHFKKELSLIPSKKLVLIAIGNYALTLCRNVLEDKPLSHARGIMEYIRTFNPEEEFSLSDKKISLFPFIHPSHREQVLKRWDRNDKVKNKEKSLLKNYEENSRLRLSREPVEKTP